VDLADHHRDRVHLVLAERLQRGVLSADVAGLEGHAQVVVAMLSMTGIVAWAKKRRRRLLKAQLAKAACREWAT
jgi:hypothetical protein